jgi:hypothetical protein
MEKRLLVPTEQEAGWVLELVRMLGKRQKSLASARNEPPSFGHPVYRLDLIPTTLF